MASFAGMRSFLLWAFGDTLKKEVARELKEKHQQEIQMAAAALRTAQQAYTDLERSCLGRLDQIESVLRGTSTWRDVEYSRAGVPEGPGPTHEEVLKLIKGR